MERLAERRQNSVRMCLLAPTFVLEQAAEKPFLVQCSFQPHFDFRGDIQPRDAYSMIFYTDEYHHCFQWWTLNEMNASKKR